MKKRLVLIEAMLLLLMGCQNNYLQQRACTTKINYSIKNGFSADKPESRIYVLPAQVNTGYEQYGKVASGSLAKALDGSGNGFKVLSFSDFANRLNETDMHQEYSGMMDFYQKYGLFKKADLENIGCSFGIDYFIIPSVLDIKRWNENRVSAVGVKFINTQKICIMATIEIWSASGYNVFSLSCDVTIADERIKENPISIERVFEQAWLAAIQQFNQTEPE